MPQSLLHPVILAVPASDLALERREKVKALGRRARSALDQSARLSGWPLDLQRLEKGELGAPIPQGDIHWSLSHKELFVAAVAAPHPVGIDIEMIKPVQDGLYERIGDDAEWSLAGGKNPENFFRYWTAKEAVLKAVGKGMTGLSHCRVVGEAKDNNVQLMFQSMPWMVIHHWVDDRHLVALTTRGDPISWHMVTE